jgi:hypothetical protein
MLNGDRYLGRVVSMNSETLVLSSDVLGTMRLPRAKVAIITLGAAPAPGAVALPPATPAAGANASRQPTNRPAQSSVDLRQLAANTNLIHQVQNQWLAGAGPEANAKFNELLGGLASGTISMDDLRAQASSAAEQLRAIRRDLGDEAGVAVDGYISILEDFLKESDPGTVTTVAPAGGSVTRKTAPATGH